MSSPTSTPSHATWLKESIRSSSAALILLFTLGLAACEVRRVPAPESTRQLRVTEARRLIDQPALSPPAWSPDSTRFAYTAGQALYVGSPGSGFRRIASSGTAASVSWSSALDLLAFVDAGAVWTIRPNGTERKRVDLPAAAISAVWAPGGDRLAVVLRRAAPAGVVEELWLSSKTGGFRRMVARAPAGLTIREMQWSPNSLYLLYGLGRRGDRSTREVWQVRVANPDRHQIPVDGQVTMVRFSPSGRAIAYLSAAGDAGIGRVVLMRPDGTGRAALTSEPGRYSGLAWSPQGDKLAFAEVRAGTARIWVSDAEAAGRVLVHSYQMELQDPRNSFSLAWSPNGRRLLFGTNSGTSIGPIWMATFERR